MKVAIYCRVSTQEQKKYGFSINTQLNELRDYAKKNKYKIVGEYLDEGVSGGKIDRPALNKLLNDIKSEKIELILFVKLDRWFRSVAHYYKIQEVLEQYNVKWKATQEDYETQTSSGQFKVNIMLSVNQQFKDATSERIKSVVDYKVKVLKQAISTPAYGYKIVDKKYVIDEDKAKHVRQFYNDLLNTHALQIAINNFVRNAGKKSDSVTRILLKKSLYCGKYQFHNEIIEDYYPPIIDEETWNKIQDIKKNNRKRYEHGNIKAKTYIFCGLLRCPVCNSKMYGTQSNGVKYYRCYKRYNSNTCNYKTYFMERKVEEELIKRIPILLKESKIENVIENEKEIINFEKKISQIKSKLNRLNELYIEGNIEKDIYNKKKETLENEYNLEYSKKKEITGLNNGSMNKLKDLFEANTFMELYNKLDDDNKAVFWQNIIEYVTVSKEQEYNVIFKCIN